MIKILVLTDDFKKWIEKFENEIKINWNRGVSFIRRDEVILRSELFSIEIRSRISENCRGKVVDVIILDKWIDTEKEWLLRSSLMGHRNSIIRTNRYYEEEKNEGIYI